MIIYTSNATCSDTDDGICIDVDPTKIIYQDEKEMRKALEFIDMQVIAEWIGNVSAEIKIITDYNKARADYEHRNSKK